MEKSRLRPFHGILALLMTALVVVVVAPRVFAPLGIWGSLIGELLMLVIAIAAGVLSREKMSRVFPLKKVHALSVLGSIFMWGSTIAIVLLIQVILFYFFPEGQKVNQAMGKMLWNQELWKTVLVVGVSPAFCEEAIFRGVFLHSIKDHMPSWLAVITVGVVFGLFHGDVWRLLPTAMIGIVITMVVLYTENLWYGALIHFINNMFSVLGVGLAKRANSYSAVESVMGSTVTINGVVIGSYMIVAAFAPLVFYIGWYLFKRGEKGYGGEIFGRDNRKTLLVLILVLLLMILAGMALISYSITKMPVTASVM